MEHALQFSPTEGKRRNMQKEMYQISCKMEANVLVKLEVIAVI
jgi:hypothetical protein